MTPGPQKYVIPGLQKFVIPGLQKFVIPGLDPGTSCQEPPEAPPNAMTTLTLDAALDGCTAALIQDGAQSAPTAPTRAFAAAPPSSQLWSQTCSPRPSLQPTQLTAIAVTIGPGSFTGVRAALALAHGMALAAAIPLRGVTTTAAIRADCQPRPGRPVWVAIDSKRGRIFLDDGATITAAWRSTPCPPPAHPIALAGDAAIPVAARLLARGHDVQLLSRFTAHPPRHRRRDTPSRRSPTALHRPARGPAQPRSPPGPGRMTRPTIRLITRPASRRPPILHPATPGPRRGAWPPSTPAPSTPNPAGAPTPSPQQLALPGALGWIDPGRRPHPRSAWSWTRPRS